MNCTWLLPRVTLPSGRTRTVGEPSSETLVKAKRRRWLSGPKGKAWLERNRERRNNYHRMRYEANVAGRREYLRAKQREYRAAKKAAQQ